ncbi:MAG: hypothetical protein JOZ59_05270 [Candidatus Eremiobacteraeota bacterium]|nr:hypothetical protein [Candidatus Eremiobacteraeota bacterium]
MAQITLNSDSFTIELTPLEQFFALHGSLHIPYSHVADATVEDRSGWKDAWRKLMGTSAPGLKMAGTFFGKGGWAFLDYRDGRNCLAITTRDEQYKQVVVQLDSQQNAADVAAQLREKATKTS